MGKLEVVVGRQAIFDRLQAVVAYELLFRPVPGSDDARGEIGGELMTALVVFGALGIGVERLVGEKRIFVNADRELLVGETLLALPPERVIVEVLETVVPDAEAVAGCRRLVLRCRDFDVDLLAEKVETTAEMEACVELGFDYFQGYLLSRPQIVEGRALEPDAAARRGQGHASPRPDNPRSSRAARETPVAELGCHFAHGRRRVVHERAVHDGAGPGANVRASRVGRSGCLGGARLCRRDGVGV